MIKIAHWFIRKKKKKKKSNKLADERLEKVTGLDKKVNPKNLICKYKYPAADVNFDEFDNAFNHLDKIKEGE